MPGPRLPSRQEYDEAVRTVSEMYASGTRVPTKEEFDQRVERAINEKHGSGFEGNPSKEPTNYAEGYFQSLKKSAVDDVKAFVSGGVAALNPFSGMKQDKARADNLQQVLKNHPNDTAGAQAELNEQRKNTTYPPLDQEASSMAGGLAATAGAIKLAPFVPRAIASTGRVLEETAATARPTGMVSAASKKGAGALGRMMQRAVPEAMSPEAAMATDNLAQQRTVKLTPNTPAAIPAEDAMSRALAEERAARAVRPNNPISADDIQGSLEQLRDSWRPTETIPSEPPTGRGEAITRPGMRGRPRRVTGYKTEQPPRNEAQYDMQQAEPATGAGPQRRQNAWSPEVTPDDLLSEDVATKLTGAPETAGSEATATPTSAGSTPLDPHHPQTYKAYVDASKAAGQQPVGMSEWSYSQEDNGLMNWSSGYPKGSSESQQARRLHISNAEDRALTRPERQSQDLGDATEDLVRRLNRGTP